MKTIPRIVRGRRAPQSRLLMAALILLTAGCQSVGPNPIRDNSGPFARNNSAFIRASADQELAEVRGMMRAGEHSIVIPRLTALVSQYPDTKAAAEARYFLGLTYYKIDGLYYADQNFKKYLELQPEGKYAALSREYVQGIAAAADRKQTDRAALEAKVAKYDNIAEPEALAMHLELAEGYWNNNEYEKAGALYTKILDEWPSLKDDTIIRRRMELGPDGNYVLLTPSEVGRRYSAADPLAVFNTQTWRSGRFRSNQLDYTNVYYNVSGQVVNRSEFPLREAGVVVTIYGFGERVYDTKTYAFGRLQPGETRAFSVRFANFDSIDNVHRYECVPTFLR